MNGKITIMIVAGEASGDAHAAKLIREIKEAQPAIVVEFFGAAGPKMREAGVEAIVESDSLSIVGLAEIGRALPMFLRAKRDLKDAAIQRKPDVVILVDFPDFNLKLAKSLKKQGFLVVYYISPQLWAWRNYRISSIRKYVDLLITILPFEKDWYSKRGIEHVEYVGNPLANEVNSSQSREEFCFNTGLDTSHPIVALLPGSRHKEIERMLPVMLDAADEMTNEVPKAQFVIAAASTLARRDINDVLADRRSEYPLIVVDEQTYDVLNASDVAAVTSGTATLEAGIIGTPMAVVYASSLVNYVLLRPLISVEHYGLINLIAGERIAAELIQGDLTPKTLAAELLRLLEPSANAEMRSKLQKAADKLGQGGASKRAAEAILGLIGREGSKS
ncbi:MAG: lipid-A-disaccharide synthase [Pyrinomonadaceae bacterium]